jgi:hypothetical protein
MDSIGLQAAMQVAMGHGLDWLARHQHKDGYFSAYVASDPEISINRREDRSIFITQHVAASLLEVNDARAEQMIGLVLKFLRRESWPGSSWKFWTKDHPGAWAIPLDTDDTACVYHLFSCTRQTVASSTRELLIGNRTREGLFRTWLLPRLGHLGRPHVWGALAHMLRHPFQLRAFFAAGGVTPDDVDAVVNANAVLMFGQCDYTKHAIAWILDIIRRGAEKESDRFYQSRLALYYAIVRCWRNGCPAFEGVKDLIIERVEEMSLASHGAKHSLDTAFCAIVLGHWSPGSSAHQHVLRELLAHQFANGSWQARVLFYGDHSRGLCWGSEELTTGFCLEAFAVALRNHSSRAHAF